MAFNIKNFAFAGGAQLGPDSRIPRIFTYYSEEDSIAAILLTVDYFGLGLYEPGYNERPSITNIVSFGSIILVTSNVDSGGGPSHSTILLIESQPGFTVEYQAMPVWTP